MPELTPESTPPSAAIPPIVTPDRFEDFPMIRESFLAIVTDPEYNKALRMFGDMLFELALEFRGYWPDPPEGHLRTELRALVADLRVVQGHLLSFTESSPSTPQEGHHIRVAARLSCEVGGIADALEQELGAWRGETE